jgi:hypothetical protein
MATKEININTRVLRGYTRDNLVADFARMGFNKGVEVGVRWGTFSKVMCEFNKNLVLKSVDPYNLVYQDMRSNREGLRLQKKYFRAATNLLKPYPNCELVKKTSLEAVVDFPYESIDFVYIDGSHQFDYVMTDIIEWAKRVRKDGIISGHDYYHFIQGDVVRAVDNYALIHGVKKIYLTDERTPTWWFKRTW